MTPLGRISLRPFSWFPMCCVSGPPAFTPAPRAPFGLVRGASGRAPETSRRIPHSGTLEMDGAEGKGYGGFGQGQVTSEEDPRLDPLNPRMGLSG